MWRRHDKPIKNIGSPTLVDSPHDQDSVRKLRDLAMANDVGSIKPQAVRRPSYDKDKQLPKVPPPQGLASIKERFSRKATPQQQQRNDQNSPTTPLPTKPRVHIPKATPYNDVSPPDSPRSLDGGKAQGSPNISPVSTFGSGSKNNSNAWRKDTSSTNSLAHFPSRASLNPKDGDGTSSPRREYKNTKWDEYSGEPTDSEKGKRGQVSPTTAAASLSVQQLQQMGVTTSISTNNTQKPKYLTDKLKSIGRRSPSPSGQNRDARASPDGKNSGADSPDEKTAKAKPLPTPSERRRKGVRTTGVRQQMNAGGSAGSPPEPPLRETSIPRPVQPNSRPAAAPAAAAPVTGRRKPSRDNGRGGIRIERTQSEGFEPSPSLARSNVPGSLDLGAASAGEEEWKVSSNTTKLQPSSLPPLAISPHSPLFLAGGSKEAKPELDSRVGRRADLEEPLPGRVAKVSDHDPRYNGSRFGSASVSSFTGRVVESPPSSPQTSPGAGGSVLNRKRPIRPSGSQYSPKSSSSLNPYKVSSTLQRKPTPSTDSVSALDSMPARPADKAGELEAKLASLQKRKANVNTMMSELTDVAQPSSITYDSSSRAEIRKTVESLGAELAKIEKEIHETGLKLHRLHKKRDMTSYEPTGLWIRRVTE